jgi:uncharacterized cupin superfamily protein
VTRAYQARPPGAPREGRPAARVRARISWHEYLRGALVSPGIVPLDGRVEAELSELPAERLIAGTPELRVRNFFTDTSQQFFAGRWSASRGKWRVRYTENELCVMTAGRVTIESASGERSSFAAGDAFVVPAGFVGTWEVVEDCAKIYAVFETRG